MVLSNSVSIQRVWTVKVAVGSVGANAGSTTMARWNARTVGIPSMTNSASARRERSIASWRVRPVTMSLASIESNAPPMTSPSTTPESTRTPGPAGGRKIVTVPGAGRNPRPASSPFMRNSIEWACGSGSVVERAAGRDAQLLANQVDPGDLFGHRVLDL